VSFFDPLPEEPPQTPAPAPRGMPSWLGPPEDMLPGVVALELPLVHTDEQVMWIAAAEAYPEGITFSVLMCGRRPAEEGVESGSGTWRFGVQFSDGRKATVHGVGMFSRAGAVSSVSGGVALAADHAQSPPDGLVLRARGGGGSRSAWRQQYWLWPLPPAGDVLFACQWPDLQIDFSTATISADPILKAANRARPMWPG
jgi:hypothetical protein